MVPWGFPGALLVENPLASADGHKKQVRSLGRKDSPGGRHGDSLKCSCLEKPMDRGAWRATVHGGAQSWTRLKGLSRHAYARGSTGLTDLFKCEPCIFASSPEPTQPSFPSSVFSKDFLREFQSRSGAELQRVFEI